MTREHGAQNRGKPRKGRMGEPMKKLLSAVMSVAFMVAMTPMADAQSQCPPEVAQAKAMISKISKGQDVQAPRSLARAKQDVQAPRSREIQAPRSLAGQRPRCPGAARSGRAGPARSG